MKIRSTIIDDDPFIQTLLQDLIQQHFKDIEIVGLASNGKEGVQIVKSLQPDILFLDVEMEDMTGFDVLEQLGQIDFQTIFITSYSHYAIKAIRFNALDYLVKPIDIEELKAAIKRYKTHGYIAKNQQQIELALENRKTQKPEDKVLFLQSQEGELKIVLKDMVRIEGDRNYSYIYLKNNKKKLVSKNLGYFEEILSDKGFFRCHKSHLVNGRFVQTNKNKDVLILHDQTQIPISRRKKAELKVWLNS